MADNNKIFCLETEWVQSIHDLKSESQVKPMLDFLWNSAGIYSSFRQVACKEDFTYYIKHLQRDAYNNFGIVYLCFHGLKGLISFANGTDYKVLEMADELPDVFLNRVVHFGSCYTLRAEDDILDFKRKSKAVMVTGYQRSVDITDSFIFEAWLLNAMTKHPEYRAKRLMDLAKEEMGYWVDKLQFVAY